MSSSSSKKRKGCIRCGCDSDHASELEEEWKLKQHRTVAAKIAMFSPTISIFVGTKKQVFQAQKDLLTLHSHYFKDLFCTYMSLIKPRPGLVECWELGNFLRAPAYQNMCMYRTQKYAMDSGASWPRIHDVQTIHEICGKGSKMRKFAAHSVASKKPFESCEEGSQECLEWTKLLQDWPDLAVEIAKVTGKDWFGENPWDDEFLRAYLEDEPDLEVEWDKQILASRSLEDIREAATKEKCTGSMIELDHLERNKPRKKS
ncbi:uncharacterized protein PAC_11663 [Phialocephala subalpina]|uniref:BTB domain-containing protein n=1 Tax=Phialocephala subalpina TaxID=576137 RepID=A0A1L7X9U8_9HELO|nr:uncharacterized protein PAC_11663 [Phialocephala subalpina]